MAMILLRQTSPNKLFFISKMTDTYRSTLRFFSCAGFFVCARHGAWRVPTDLDRLIQHAVHISVWGEGDAGQAKSITRIMCCIFSDYLLQYFGFYIYKMRIITYGFVEENLDDIF